MEKTKSQGNALALAPRAELEFDLRVGALGNPTSASGPKMQQSQSRCFENLVQIRLDEARTSSPSVSFGSP